MPDEQPTVVPIISSVPDSRDKDNKEEYICQTCRKIYPGTWYIENSIITTLSAYFKSQYNYIVITNQIL